MRAMRRAMQETVDVVGASAASRGHRLPLRQGRHGRPGAQRGPAGPGAGRGRRGPGTRLRRGRPALARARRDAARSIGAAGVLGATFTPHCAAVQPALLARGLADAVERHGRAGSTSTRRYSTSGPARRATGRRSCTTRRHRPGRRRGAGDRGLDADAARAASAPSSRCTRSWWPPSRSATDFWASAGLDEPGHLRRPPPHDHLRAAHGRRPHRLRGPGCALPLRLDGAPRLRHASRRVHALLRQTLAELFPEVADARFTHAWGGPLGIPRDWHSSVGLRPRHGPGLGRRLRRRRRVHHQPGRAHAGRPHHRGRHRADPAALGRAPSRRAGSPSRCAGSASTPGCGR